MINRIVRLSFMPDKVEEFLRIFEQSKSLIASFKGCEGLTLLQDAAQLNVFYTYSLWQSGSHLEDYRHSELFKTTWKATRALFNDKPMAFSTTVNQKVK
jgi:heme oxygenase (mycobilin-producing)